MNIIPDVRIGRSPDYWCTWTTQCTTKPANVRGGDYINESLIFAPETGWVNFYPEIRSELYFVLDDGWDVPADAALPQYGTLYPDPIKFPSLHGTQTERLAQLNAKIQSAGWRGAGLWIATNYIENGETKPYVAPDPTAEGYWRERAVMSHKAGIEYWKADWGNNCESMTFRRMLTDVAREAHPRLLVEHGRGHRPFNGTGAPGNCRFTQDEAYFCYNMGVATFSDVLRIYDLSTLSVATALDRIASYVPVCKGILNCEDELYMGAALGYAVGIMRHPGCECAEEALAAVRWHRVAPAFSGGNLRVSDRLLTESHFYESPACGMDGPGTIYQQAPAVVARNTALPEVLNADAPMISFVAASMNPSGAYSVAAFRRQTDGARPDLPAVICRPETPARYIGVFGDFSELTIVAGEPQGRLVTRVLAQSLIRGEAVDITAHAVLDGHRIFLPAALLRSFRNVGDGSELALMLKVSYT